MNDRQIQDQMGEAGGDSHNAAARYLTAIHVCAPNDVNGNPQRCYVVVAGEEIVAVVDEGYEGEAALREMREADHVAVMPHRINVEPAEYERWIAIGEELGR